MPDLKRKRSDPTDGESTGVELLDELDALMNLGTAKSRLLARTVQPQPFFPVCEEVTAERCSVAIGSSHSCAKVHMQPILRPHTDPALGHCSYLNTCYGEPSYAQSPSLGGGGPAPRTQKDCKYLHFEVAPPPPSAGPNAVGKTSFPSLLPPTAPRKAPSDPLVPSKPSLEDIVGGSDVKEAHWPPSWLTCDVRKFDLEVLGKFDVIMADPPWDIHMNLPYGTMTDDEMRSLPIPAIQSEGLLFLWVTARAMELGRDLLAYWGYRRVDEIVWCKTNQLGRLIRTGRTGHWLNHTCEHLLVGLKSPADPATPDVPNTTWPAWLQRGLDTDVLVSEVRETSRKPDEVYDLIERCCSGGRKLEIFGRKHNTRPGWLTIGNQIGGDCIHEPQLARRFQKRYPERPNLADAQ